MIGDLIKIKPEEVRAATVKKRRKPPLWKRPWLRRLLLVIVLTGLTIYVAGMMYLRQFRERAAQFDLTKMKELEVSTILHDRNGKEIAELADENRRPVTLAEIPLHFIHALTAAEDGRFFQHKGVDYFGIARAAYWTYVMQQGRQGGSTITQQLARQAFANEDPSMLAKTKERKLTEMFLAMRIEENYTKSEILEMYLNRIYFGSGCFGVNAAAMRYFGKGAKDLDLLESATLCGLIKSPERYSPLRDLEAARKTRNLVLDRMVEDHTLGAVERDSLRNQPVKVSPSSTARGGGHVIDKIHQEIGPILDELGYEELGGQGLHVYTSLDVDLQKAAEESVKKHLAEIESRKEYQAWMAEINRRDDRKDNPRRTYADYCRIFDDWQKSLKSKPNPENEIAPEPTYLQGAVMCVDNKSGDILAMVGGRDWAHNKINLSDEKLQRPPGTAFFPFVYGAAFEGKLFPGTRVDDTALDNSRVMVGSTEGLLGEWGRELQTATPQGKITARGALMQSMNGATARVALDERVGVRAIKEFAERCGLHDVKDIPAMILGVSETSVRDLCLAYTTFANGGKRTASTQLVTKITDVQGRTLWDRKAPKAMIPVTDEVTAFMITSCLQDAMAVGTASPARESYGLKDFPVAGKTGTHYEFRDLWFAGYSSEVTCAVWTGYRERPETIYPSAYSSRCALPIWVDVMNSVQDKRPGRPFPVPEKIELVDLCAMSGLRATDRCFEVQQDPASKRPTYVKTTYKEYIRPGFRLDQVCDYHVGSEHDPEIPEAVPKPPPVTAMAKSDRISNSINPIPVALKAPIVVGNDPYKAFQPEIGPETAAKPAASKVDSQNVPAIIQTPDLTGKPKFELPEPPPIKID